MINRVILVGRLTRDPEMRMTSNERSVVRFGLAVNRSFRNQQGERETDFFDVTAWGKTAELVHQYMHKGRMVGIDGRIQMRKYTAKDGSQRTAYDIVAETVHFLDSRGDQGDREEAPPPPRGEEEPPPSAVDDVLDDGELPF